MRLYPFWWNESQKNMTTPKTAKRASIRWRISWASISISALLDVLVFTFLTAFLAAGSGSTLRFTQKMISETSIMTMAAMNAYWNPRLKTSR